MVAARADGVRVSLGKRRSVDLHDQVDQLQPLLERVFIRRGVIEPGVDGMPRAELDIGLVAHTGEIAEGRLERGQNPVLITFELVIEVQEAAPHAEQNS